MGCSKPDHLVLSMTPLQRGTVMDPSQIYFLNEYYIIENLTVRLVEMDSVLGYKLMLASKIDQKSPTRYEIRIRDTGFSDGEKITVEHVKDSLKRASQNANSHVAFKEIVKKIESKNDVLIIELNKSVNDFLYFLSLADLSVLHPKQVIKKELVVEDWENLSSGPFMYVITDGEVYLKKNPHYKLSSGDYPEKIRLVTSREKDSFLDFKNGEIDLGEFNLNSYDLHLAELEKINNLHVIGNNGDMINFFALNIDNPKFKNLYNRQWIQKKILSSYSLDSRYKTVARKAFQFLTPQVRGFVSESKIQQEVDSWNHIDLNKVPEELKSGITISTYQRAFEVTLKGAFKDIEKILGIPVRIDASVVSVGFQKFVSKREYEVFLGITSMDQVIVGEAIHLKYFSSTPLFRDPTKKIKKLLDLYQHSEAETTIDIVNKISMQMIEDSECIPVFYVASPFFYNKEKLDIADLDEMTYFNLWKLKLK